MSSARVPICSGEGRCHLTPEELASLTPQEVAWKLLQAVALPGDQRVEELGHTRLSEADCYRLACHLIFRCQRCGTCCTTGNPIRVDEEDVDRLARHLKMPFHKAMKKLAVPHPTTQGEMGLALRKVQPCKFYDPSARSCRVYHARPWSCRIFPFLGTYGQRNQILLHQSCPGSTEAARLLTLAMEEVSRHQGSVEDPQRVKDALRWFELVLKSLDLG